MRKVIPSSYLDIMAVARVAASDNYKQYQLLAYVLSYRLVIDGHTQTLTWHQGYWIVEVVSDTRNILRLHTHPSIDDISVSTCNLSLLSSWSRQLRSKEAVQWQGGRRCITHLLYSVIIDLDDRKFNSSIGQSNRRLSNLHRLAGHR